MCVCVCTRQVCVRLVLGGELEDSEQQLLSGGQQEAVSHGGEEGGRHFTHEGDQGLHVAGVRQPLGLQIGRAHV